MSGKKPNLVVYGKSITAGNQIAETKHWKRIGVGWTNETAKGVKHIRIQLDFMPNDGLLTVWPDGERPSAEEEP